MKNPMKTIIALLLLVTCSTAALARLGETNVEIKARYGAVSKRTDTGTNTWSGAYTFKEYNIFVYFRSNRCECEYVYPIEARKFADAERDALINSIAGNDHWIRDHSASASASVSDLWRNKDTGAVAFVKNEAYKPSMLVVSSHDFALQAGTDQEKEEKSRAAGF